MNVKNDSTGTPAGATDIYCQVPAKLIDSIGDDIERVGGMIAKAKAAKHLSDLLMTEVQRLLDRERGKSTAFEGMRTYPISDHSMDTIDWLLGEVWEKTRDLAEMVDTLQNDMVPLANAAYDVLKLTRPAA